MSGTRCPGHPGRLSWTAGQDTPYIGVSRPSVPAPIGGGPIVRRLKPASGRRCYQNLFGETLTLFNY